jgi:hypothetical protein
MYAKLPIAPKEVIHLVLVVLLGIILIVREVHEVLLVELEPRFVGFHVHLLELELLRDDEVLQVEHTQE